MSKRKHSPTENGDLRRKAEERLTRANKSQPMHAADAARLVHELEVHRVELELQNEELRAARNAAETGLARYTDLFEFAPIGYVTLSDSGIIGEINRAGMMLLAPAGALVGRRLAAFLAPSDTALFNATLHQAASGPQKQQVCEVGLAPQEGLPGEPGPRVRMTLARLHHPTRPTILCALEDTTAQRRHEAQLARAEEALRDADRRKNEFLGVLSHELRNPLAPMKSGLYILTHTGAGGEQRQRALAVIDRQVTHLTRLVDDLLDVTRIARGKVQLRPERVELGDLVRQTVEDHRAGFERNGIAIEARFDPGRFWVNADPARLVQVVSNLLGNAEKFTPRGGRVTVSIEREGEHFVLRVVDTGAGLAPGVQEHLFEPFAQGPQTMERSRGGLGLGLAMVKGLVELHGGSVGIASEGAGRGTLVTVRLPSAEPGVSTVSAAKAPALRSRRVLLIEDNLDGADSLRDALEMDGHEVRIARDGPAGLELMRTFRPEIVLCDVGLPGMDGYEVARTVRTDPALHSAYLVALSGYALPEDLHRAAEAGFNEHVAKPPSLERLGRLLAGAPAM